MGLSINIGQFNSGKVSILATTTTGIGTTHPAVVAGDIVMCAWGADVAPTSFKLQQNGGTLIANFSLDVTATNAGHAVGGVATVVLDSSMASTINSDLQINVEMDFASSG